ncbi:DUF4406 domain-containing protein [Oscillospiraceae bacterium OttesenSCG-928-F05]|nr:DUF4406 domain-containing protein [Oscillospiraceae bacterium OttesenSCG-928-F05]
MKLVYICAPYAGDIPRNTALTRAYCAAAVAEGAAPMSSALLFTQFLDDSDPKQREIGLAMGLKLLCRCDELWLCTEHISPGMQRELEQAELAGIPVQDRSQDWQYITMGGADACTFTPQT